MGVIPKPKIKKCSGIPSTIANKEAFEGIKSDHFKDKNCVHLCWYSDASEISTSTEQPLNVEERKKGKCKIVVYEK